MPQTLEERAMASGYSRSSSKFNFESAVLRGKELRELKRDPTIAVALEIPFKLHQPVKRGSSDTQDIPKDSAAWGIRAIRADASNLSGTDVKVAVLDTGIDANHQAFTGVNLEIRDFTGEGPDDIDGHGTHCAGTIFGRPVDGVRIGVAQGVTHALIGKVLGSKGGSTNTILNGIQWALDQSAQIISLSLGFDFPGLVQIMVCDGVPVDIATSKALQAYRDNLELFGSVARFARARTSSSHAILFVAAAGNESRRDEQEDFVIAASPPAAADGMIAVGALGLADNGNFRITDFSNSGAAICAPGEKVLSAKSGGGLIAMCGTSMAGPHVAGVAALVIEKIRQTGVRLTSELLHARILGQATTDLIQPGFDPFDIGVGLVQAPL